MKKRLMYIAFALVNLIGGATVASAQKYDYDWAYDPITHQPILICVSCLFWSCDCGET